ncbi:glycoside hydrolase family 99-like domain-containing protein [bacterium]|nr:glycoside hydrolase family 99-like domain-containing protein [bacterium]
MNMRFSFKVKVSYKDKFQYYDYIENYGNYAKKDCVPITESFYDNSSSIKPIAFYLPQFHSIPLNDKNFGKGFTEWTNVSKALPQFPGHHQPQIPIDVGFYDLTHDDVMYRQIELAKMYGIYGFCFYYYWFSGKRLLEKPLFNWLNNKDLNLPFCLCWANENWSKLWDGGNKEVVMEQKLQDDDDEKFFYDILPFLKDERYIKVDNKPVLLIYRLNLFEKERVNKFIKNIRALAEKEGLFGIHLVGVKSFELRDFEEYDVDASVEFPPFGINPNLFDEGYVNKNFVGEIYDMTSYVEKADYINENNTKLYKSVFCGWDNTARKVRSGAAIFLLEPDLYKKWLYNIMKWTRKNHKENDRLVFINAWNEWGEGAHLEPSLRYGYAYLQATKEALEEVSLTNEKNVE